jgi:hypothetical protein
MMNAPPHYPAGGFGGLPAYGMQPPGFGGPPVGGVSPDHGTLNSYVERGGGHAGHRGGRGGRGRGRGLGGGANGFNDHGRDASKDPRADPRARGPQRSYNDLDAPPDGPQIDLAFDNI